MTAILTLFDSAEAIPLSAKVQKLWESFACGYELRVLGPESSLELCDQIVAAFVARGGKIVICFTAVGSPLAAFVSHRCSLPVMAVTSEVASPLLGFGTAGMAAGEAGLFDAGLFALRCLAAHDTQLAIEFSRYQKSQAAKALQSDVEHRKVFHGA